MSPFDLNGIPLSDRRLPALVTFGSTKTGNTAMALTYPSAVIGLTLLIRDGSGYLVTGRMAPGVISGIGVIGPGGSDAMAE